MAETGIFSVDIDEAFGATASDCDMANSDIGQTSTEYQCLAPADLPWSYEENGQTLVPIDALPKPGTTAKQSRNSDLVSNPVPRDLSTPEVHKQRFVRPESLGKGSPGFTYTRPDMKYPNQRRNLVGKVQNEAWAKKEYIPGDTVVAGESHDFPPGDLCKGRSGLQSTVTPLLQASSVASKVRVEHVSEEQCERDSGEPFEPAREPEPLSPRIDHGQSRGRLNLLGASNTVKPLPELSPSNIAANLRVNDSGLHKAHSPLESHSLSKMNLSTGHRNPTYPGIRERPSDPTQSVLKPHATGKVEKRKTERQRRDTHVRPTVEPNRCVPDQFEILQILAFRTKQERDAQQATTHDLLEHKKRLEQIKSEYSELEARLNQGQEREQAQSAELARFKSLLLGLKGKARKLDDYIKGLSNDHNKLREDAISVRQQQDTLQDDRRVIQTAIAEARSTLQTITMIDRGALTEARLQLGNLQKVINHQHGQLMDKSELLDMERKRLRTLEGELARLVTSQEHIAESVRDAQKELLKRLQVLDENQKRAQAEGKKDNIPSGALKRCVELLEQIHNREGVQPEDLHRLEGSIQAHLQSITNSVELANNELDNHQGTETNLLIQFESLVSGFKSQEDLAEMTTQLRETESVLRERTLANENLLAVSRQQINDLQNKESAQLQVIANLQAKLNTPIAPSENPRLLQQIHELESQNAGLAREATSLQATIESLKEQVNAQHDELLEAAEKSRQGELAIEEVKTLTAKEEQVKADYEARAVKQRESLRQELSKASTEEKKAMAKEHYNALHQLQRQLSTARDNNVKVETKLEDALRIHGEQAQTLETLRAKVDEYTYEKNENEKSINHLEAQLQEATQSGLVKDAEIQTLQEANAAFEKERKEAQLQKDETAHRLASHTADSASKHTKFLAQINSLCAKNDKAFAPATAIDDALKILGRQIKALRDDSQATFAATQGQSQELLFSSEQDPIDTNSHSGELEDVALISQDKNSGTQAAQASKRLTPQMSRSRATSRARQTPFSGVIHQSQVEETTTVRSVKRMTSSRGRVENVGQVGSPSKRREALPALPSFAQFHSAVGLSLQGSPAPENMKDFFPPTPLLPAWPQSATEPSRSLSKTTASDVDNSREIPPILKKPTSSVIRGDLGTSPTPNQSTHSRTKTRVEASSSKTRKSLETTETVKESTAPKGILKASHVWKRSATDASLETTSQSSRKRTSAPGSGLGPVVSSRIRESQGGTMPLVEGRKKGTKRRGSGKDKYQERFAEGA